MRALLILITVLISLASSAQTMTLSLAEAQAKALEMNRDAQIATLEIEKAKRVVKETMAIGLPQINAEGSFQNFLDIPTQVLPDFISPAVYGVLINEDLLPAGSGGQPGLIPAQFGTNYNVSGGATLSQLIFNGSYIIGLKAAKSYVEMSELQKNKSDIDIKAAVAEAYHTVLLAQENSKVLTESISTLEQTYREVSAMYAEGFVEEQDTEQLLLTLNAVVGQQRNVERQVALTKQLLNLQIGMPLDNMITLSDDIKSLTEAPELMQMAGIEKANLSTHPDVLILDQGILLQELMVKEQRSQYLPTLNGFFNHSQNALRNDFDFFDGAGEWFPSTVWGLNLSIPIFSSGMKHQKVKQLQIDLQESQLRKEQALDGLALSANRAKSDYVYALEDYQLRQENLALAERIRDKTRIKYSEGISSSFELNEIEQQYIQTQGEKVASQAALLNAVNAFKKAYNLF